MKIVQISSTATYGGAGIAALRLHQSLMKHSGIESVFVQRLPVDAGFAEENNIYTAATGRGLITRFRKKYNVHTEHYHWVNLNKYPADYEIATFGTTSYRLEELPVIKEADIIHLHWVAEFLNYPTFFKNIKQPIVWTLHDMNPFRGMFHYREDEEKNRVNFGELDKKTLRIKTDAIHKHKNINVVCLSEWMKGRSQASEAFGIYPHYLIPNGLDFSKYPVLDKHLAKKAVGVDNALLTILFVANGSHIYRKGFDLVVDALAALNRKDYNLISVGGDKIEVGTDIKHIHHNRIDNIAQLNELYSAADMTVLPSREDNLPNVMLESFANGTPVMSFTNGGMAEHVKTGENGVLINTIGSAPLAQGIEDFLNNRYIFDSEKIRDYALTHFSDTLQVEKYINLYKEILNR
ncbi:glycosyltransferase involved in cell wall biosynthesis [Dysgonomonas sp. PFB1-18]|uniref:glycosyltransferase n=1 Tax=unclassified Dysgonomonas TaxID=2630389 RepID=UPI0024767A33|nr:MULTISPECIES: glycosyltransferase [unclassified Dysgonomonas]MDH6309753.1 glycosyltransferase involved in cell wall biosynthesis [Dysgonomonas sp. PF1-14]MDH6339239.1 glycosyltransferase involved in cell wall biosynthesis [Dysgonomonas sp. PF1-16]MDH6380738.1 glycosyltransferase involved in cell wall biosynthesis [Dysgonomonas sp. PFB1-18]MDH6398234.1 glycosyltransferase involved in cell wall biosynthesis [Dysgonomonas sp. PF1-23]